MCHREGGVEQVRNVQAQLESELSQCPFTPKLSTWSPDSRCGRAGVLPTPNTPVTRVSFLATFWPRATAQSKSVAMLMAWVLFFPATLFCIASIVQRTCDSWSQLRPQVDLHFQNGGRICHCLENPIVAFCNPGAFSAEAQLRHGIPVAKEASAC